MAGFEDFESLGNSKCKCKACGEVIDTGILNLILHYDVCPEQEVIVFSAVPKAKAQWVKRKDLQNERH
jgi:hypothetical protein